MTKNQKKTNSKPLLQSAFSRREFLGKSVIATTGISLSGLYSCFSGSTKRNDLRVIAYNVYKCAGWPADKVTEKSQIPDLLAQELAQYEPDIINFSESPDEETVKKIAKQLGMNYAWFPSAGNWPGAILTRFEIIDSANVPIINGNRPDDLFTRHWGKATLRRHSGEVIVTHSVHLFPFDNQESREIRWREISKILDSAEEDINDNKSVLVIGDLNHTPEMPEYTEWINAGWVDTFAKVGKGEGFTIRADEPGKRIDYILAHGPITNKISESRPLFEGAFRTDPSNPDSFALSDHLPQYAVFESGD